VDISAHTSSAARHPGLWVTISGTKRETKSRVNLAIDRLEAEMNQLARHYGPMIGVDYGEPFLQKELLRSKIL